MSSKRVTRKRDKGEMTRDGFANVTARMGFGAQNLLSQGTYVLGNQVTRNRIKLEAMYRGSWIVGQIVDAVAEDMTRAGLMITGTTEPDQIQQVQSKLVRLGVWQSLLDAIKWGRLYGGALACIIIDGQDTTTPLDTATVGINQFRGLRVYDRWGLQPDMQNLVQDGIDVGMPAYYSVLSDINSGAVSNVKFHHSRVIRFSGIKLPIWQAITEQYWGESIIERLEDRLVAFDTATAGAANLIQKAHLRTIGIDGLREILAAGGKAEENLLTMFHHMALLQNNEGITLLDKNDDFAAHTYTYAGLSDIILQFGQQVSGASKIPMVRLFGQSPAGLNATGESDLRMYYDGINAAQNTDMRDGMMRILRVLHRSMFGCAAPDNFDFDFVSLWQTTSKEKTEIAAAITNSVAIAFEKDIITQATALQELKQSSDQTGIYTNITDEQIEDAKLVEAPEPVENQPIAPVASPTSLMDRLRAWTVA